MFKPLKLGLLAFGFLSLTNAFAPSDKLNSTKTHIQFFSHTTIEDIEAHNYKARSTVAAILEAI